MIDNKVIQDIDESLCEANAAVEIDEVDRLMGLDLQFVNFAECTHLPVKYNAPDIFYETDKRVYDHLIRLCSSMLWKIDKNDYKVHPSEYCAVQDINNITVAEMMKIRDMDEIDDYNRIDNFLNTNKNEGLILDKYYKYKSYKSTTFLKGIPDFRAINNYINYGGQVNERSLNITIMYYVGNLKNSGMQFNEFDSKYVDENNQLHIDMYDYMDYLYWLAVKRVDEDTYAPTGFGMKIREKMKKDMIENGTSSEPTVVQGMTFKNDKSQSTTDDLLNSLPEWKLKFYNMRWDKEDKLYKSTKRDVAIQDLRIKDVSEEFAVNPCNFPGSNYPNENYLEQEKQLNIHMSEYEVQKLMYPHLKFDNEGYCLNPQDDFKPNASINRYKYRICSLLTDYEKDRLTSEEMFFVQSMKNGKIFPSWEMDPVLPIPYNKDIKFEDVNIDFERFVTLKDVQKVAYLNLKFDDNGKCLNIENISIPNKNYNRYKYRMMEALGPREMQQMTIDEKITYAEYIKFGLQNYIEKMEANTNLSKDEIIHNYQVIQKDRLRQINQFDNLIKDIKYTTDFEDMKQSFEFDVLMNKLDNNEEIEIKCGNKKEYIASKYITPQPSEFDFTACIMGTK